MKNRNDRFLLTALLSLFLVVFAGMVFAQENSGKEAVQIIRKPGVGNYLAGSNGMTIYYFKNDSPGKSVCDGPCIKKWPAYCYKVDELAIPKGLKKSDFGWFLRADGVEQTTYKGMPLYRYSGDQVSGDTNGQGLNDVWFVVNP